MPDPFEPARDGPRHLDAAERASLKRALLKLGLWAGCLSERPVCHGYVNCCRCPACVQLEQQIAANGFDGEGKVAPPPRSRQPWEPQPARRRESS